MKVAVLGGGAVAQALWHALPKPILRWQRPAPLPDLRGVDLVLLAVSDGAIAGLCAELEVGPRQVVAHLAGALGTAPLQAAQARGAHTGVFHPLRAFVRGAPAALRGAAAGITAADPRARTRLRTLARTLGMTPVDVPDRARPLYHAAAVLAAGAQVALFAEATRAFALATGTTGKRARAALLPLTLGALGKLEAMAPAMAITGPAVRGDAARIRAHRSALPADLLPLYDALARVSVRLAREGKRADPAALRAVLRALAPRRR
jgi:predicted short-subunit dehydrogenase-like oxidoreductase (DUF2520 family)